MSLETVTVTSKKTRLQYTGDNWAEVLDLVEMDKFRLSLGVVSVITENGGFEQVNKNDSILKGDDGLIVIMSESNFNSRYANGDVEIEVGENEPEEIVPEVEYIEEKGDE